MTLPFEVTVLGGTFRVIRLDPSAGSNAEALTERIRQTPEERWFVMSGEDGNASQEAPDALALIDDNFKFRTFAFGRLETP